MIQKILCLAIIANVTPSLSFAQKRFEIEPFVGSRFGGTLRSGADDPEPVKIRSSVAAGFSFALNLGKRASADLTWTRQPTSGSVAGIPGHVRLTLNEWLVGGSVKLLKRETRFQPFFDAGFGVTHISGAASGGVKLGMSLGFGLKYFLCNWGGLRFDLRWAGIYLYSGPDKAMVVYGPQAATTQPIDHGISQGQATLGWIFRF